MKFMLPAVLAASLLFSCSQTNEPSETLKQANEVHNEALAIFSEAHALHHSLKKRAAESTDERLAARLDSIHALLHGWEDGVYEVPGFEHEHGGEGHSHEHSHKHAPSMTDQSMLEYQENAKKAIEEIRDALKEMVTNE